MSENLRTSLFFVCSNGHNFLVSLSGCPNYSEYEDGGFVCIEEECIAEATFLRQECGYCGHCGAPVWRGNPWWGTGKSASVSRWRKIFSDDDMNRMYVCKTCVTMRKGGATLINQFCANCGDSHSVSDDDRQIQCDNCKCV